VNRNASGAHRDGPWSVFLSLPYRGAKGRFVFLVGVVLAAMVICLALALLLYAVT
jgi:hypothetical protein